MLIVHHLGISQSDRAVWVCEELEVPYELIRYERDAVTKLAPAKYKALHPAGTAPVITDGNVVLAESGAVVEYIARKHGGGRLILGAEHPDFAAYLYWFHFANGTMMPNGMIELVLTMAGADTGAGTLSGLRERSDRAYAMIEQRLGEVPWFAGAEFTLADVMMVFPLTTMRLFQPRDISGLPNTLAYLQRVGERPAFRRAMEKADPGFAVPLS